MTNLQIFNYESNKVRIISGEDGEPWFVAKDVCDILELANARDAVSILDDDEKSSVRISDGTSPKGGNPNMNIISESGLYTLIMRSNKPEAKKFRKWVTSEVLPSIRKTGCYSAYSSSDGAHISAEELEIRRREIDTKREELKLRAAELLRQMTKYPACPMTDETKTVFEHEAFKIITGHEYLPMLPEVREAWYSATDIGKKLGVSKKQIGIWSNKYGIKASMGERNEYGHWIQSKSPHCNKECPTFVYNDAALKRFQEIQANS